MQTALQRSETLNMTGAPRGPLIHIKRPRRCSFLRVKSVTVHIDSLDREMCVMRCTINASGALFDLALVPLSTYL